MKQRRVRRKDGHDAIKWRIIANVYDAGYNRPRAQWRTRLGDWLCWRWFQV